VLFQKSAVKPMSLVHIVPVPRKVSARPARDCTYNGIDSPFCIAGLHYFSGKSFKAFKGA
jgi:hypothetical protein